MTEQVENPTVGGLEQEIRPKTLTKAWSRWQGILVVSAISVPMLLAYLIFKTGWAMPTSTVNKGDLLTPATSILSLEIKDQAGNSVALTEGKKRWRMLSVVNNSCDDVCVQQLYVSRQVHKRLSEKSVRVERVLLNTSASYSPEFKALLDQQYPRLKQYSASADQWTALMSSTSVGSDDINGHRVFFVDQEGFAMMSYQPHHEGADLLSDIKRLLKYSYED